MLSDIKNGDNSLDYLSEKRFLLQPLKLCLQRPFNDMGNTHYIFGNQKNKKLKPYLCGSNLERDKL